MHARAGEDLEHQGYETLTCTEHRYGVGRSKRSLRVTWRFDISSFNFCKVLILAWMTNRWENRLQFTKMYGLK